MYLIFWGLVHISDSMIGTVRSLFTLFRFEHRQEKSQRSPSISAATVFSDAWQLISQSLTWSSSSFLLDVVT